MDNCVRLLTWCLLLGTLVQASPEPVRYVTKDEHLQSSNYTASVVAVRCEEAKIRCALRQGCSSALQVYMLDCADLMAGRVDHCDEYCKSSLIALTSTEDGSALINCECRDAFCAQTKARVDVCREEVLKATAEGSVVSCGIAHLICLSDSQCSLALSFYERHCPRMFRGKSCTANCNNSISILRRQQQAHRLETCECEDTETFDCKGIKQNMAKLCFHRDTPDQREDEHDTNHIAVGPETLNDTLSTAPPSGHLLQELLWMAVGSAVARWRLS